MRCLLQRPIRRQSRAADSGAARAGHRRPRPRDQLENSRRRARPGSLAREYTITYRDHLEREREGGRRATFWTNSRPRPRRRAGPEVSIEQSIHERFNINVGDRCGSTSSAAAIAARVTSVREVEWADARSGGFMFVFRPGALDEAPHTFIGIAEGPDGLHRSRAPPARPGRRRFPNVSAIDVREILATVQAVVDNVTLGDLDRRRRRTARAAR